MLGDYLEFTVVDSGFADGRNKRNREIVITTKYHKRYVARQSMSAEAVVRFSKDAHYLKYWNEVFVRDAFIKFYKEAMEEQCESAS